VDTADDINEAWQEYLEACRTDDLRYEEVEPWAWKRLRARLRAIKRREKVKHAA